MEIIVNVISFFLESIGAILLVALGISPVLLIIWLLRHQRKQ
jgi:hypothetical protein